MRVCKSLPILLLVLCGCTVSSSGISFNWPSKAVVVPEVDDSDVIVGREFRFMIIEIAGDRAKLPPTQLSMITGKAVRDFGRANTIKDPDGNPQFRMIDHKSVKDLKGIWRELAFKYPAESYPWLILANGDAGTGKPLPTDWETLQADLHKYAGVDE